ncbi:hypothetical protein EVA_08950 [gut metagenome]|uniref:Uncharacterized protein n=1 Tax=gut metagenome TaxID=749906 RepID=J9CRW5_9ZZZZ
MVRSTKFFNSRILPGKGSCERNSMASAENSTLGKLFSSACLSAKYRANKGISSLRSRKAGK